jgi:hypothetical protein
MVLKGFKETKDKPGTSRVRYQFTGSEKTCMIMGLSKISADSWQVI